MDTINVKCHSYYYPIVYTILGLINKYTPISCTKTVAGILDKFNTTGSDIQ